MKLIEYIISNNLLKACIIFFLIIIFIFTDLYNNSNYNLINNNLINYNNTILNITNINNINSTDTNDNIDKCNNSIHWIYYYKNINFILGLFFVLFSSFINKNTYTIIKVNRLTLYIYMYLFVTYIFGFVILLNNYLYDCFNLIIDTNPYNFYSFIANYLVFITFGLILFLEIPIISRLLSCSFFIKSNPPHYDSIIYKLPSYNEIENNSENNLENDLPPSYIQNRNHSIV